MTRRIALVSGLVALLAFAATAFTGSNIVPTTNVGQSVRATGANEVKPASCSGITLTAFKTGSVTISGTNLVNALILGSAVADTITGKSGNECILGGGGDDTINGGTGTDVCIGGPGTDTFSNCETVIQ